jgi:hypothetical protein
MADGRVGRRRSTASDVAKVAAFAIVTGKATREVADRTGCTDPEAEAFVRRLLKLLTDGGFFKTIDDQRPPADIYGIRESRCGWWWLKLVMEHGRVTVISCHAPLHRMRLTDGTIVPGEEDND